MSASNAPSRSADNTRFHAIIYMLGSTVLFSCMHGTIRYVSAELHPFEIAFFDRGPVSAEALFSGGYWSTYWYNGHIYGSEIARGTDVFRLVPNEHLSQAEIDAAELVMVDQLNPQHQEKMEWPTAVPVAQAYLDQMVRANRIRTESADALSAVLEQADQGTASAGNLRNAAANLDAEIAAIAAGTAGGDADRMAKLADVLRELAN